MFDIGYPRFLAATGEPHNSSSAVVKHTVAWQLAKGSTSLEMTRGTTTCLYICLSSHYLSSLSPLIRSCPSILPILLSEPAVSNHFLCQIKCGPVLSVPISSSVCFPHFVSNCSCTFRVIQKQQRICQVSGQCLQLLAKYIHNIYYDLLYSS